jgi:hypothetical protein
MNMARHSTHSRDRSRLDAGLFGASLIAGAIHSAVVPEHVEEYWVFGLFFALAAAFQIAWAVAVSLVPSRQVYALGALANGLLIATWIASRTTGVPLGPEAWTPETIGALDVTASVAELAIVVGSLMAIRGTRSVAPARTRRWSS